MYLVERRREFVASKQRKNLQHSPTEMDCFLQVLEDKDCDAGAPFFYYVPGNNKCRCVTVSEKDAKWYNANNTGDKNDKGLVLF